MSSGCGCPTGHRAPSRLAHARLVTESLGIEERTIDISGAVDGYTRPPGLPVRPQRLGNVMARMRMVTLFDLSAALDALPLGTGNKSERLLGYFTWHADDAPPVNPIGDLFKTQVWALARHLGVPSVIIDKPASADLIAGQTDEGDFGLSYARADPILELLLRGYDDDAAIHAAGFTAEEIALVRKRLDSTHWKRRLPSVAMVTPDGDWRVLPSAGGLLTMTQLPDSRPMSYSRGEISTLVMPHMANLLGDLFGGNLLSGAESNRHRNGMPALS